jgi:hypothetical protein
MTYIHSHDIAWPNPADPTRLAARLLYEPASITKEDMFLAAQYMAAYSRLINDTQGHANKILRDLKYHKTNQCNLSR